MKNTTTLHQHTIGKKSKKTHRTVISPTILTAAAIIGIHKYKQTKRFHKYISQAKENTHHVKKAIILGDSVALGYGSKNGGITSYLKKYLEEKFGEVTVANKGILHLTSGGLLQKLISEKAYDRELQDSNLVFINIGGNDLLQYYHEDGPQAVVKKLFKIRSDYAKNMKKIVQYIHENNPTATIVVNQLYNSLEDHYQFFGLTTVFINYWNASTNKLPIIRVSTRTLSRKADLWTDMVHPNQAGYKELSNLMMKQVNMILER